MRRCGIPTKGFYFVPFLGGAAIGEAARTEWDDVYVTAMGPTWGLISSLPFIFMWQVTGEVKWAGYSTLILLINLINLLPIMPLDGGRLTKSLVSSGGSTALWIYLFLLCTAGFWFMWVNGLYLFLGLSIIGALEVVAEARRSKSERRPALSSLEWAVTASWFIILAAVLYGIILAFQSVEGAGLVAKVLKST
ncbi:MAG: site-2 protease family protein, partial [Proteobacteria bacterium]|nr:site-2 protease family protein [Pseudomonadota bacterium]